MKFTSIVCALIGLSAASALECDRLFARPNIHKISQDRLNRYINAVKKLNEGPRPTKWDGFARKHVALYDQIHSNPQFLAWHRIFLHEVEEELRKIDSEVRIPYWDWTVYNSNMNDDPVWNIFGRWGENNNEMCVRQGIFSDFRVLYGDDPNSNGRCLKRNSRFDDSFGGSKELINHFISSRDNVYFFDFLEANPHALLHNGIGQEFQGHASPADPIFFSHHAFIDKIWFDRQNRLPQTTLEYPLRDNTKIPGYNKQIWEAYDPFGMCYTYVPDNFSWDSSVRMQSVSVNRNEIPRYVPLTHSNSTSSGIPTDEEKQEHAHKYITEGIIAPDVNNGAKQCYDGSNTIPVGKVLDLKYIQMMKYDEADSRTKQREAAQIISEINARCLA
ncbi:Di-copper centre-containing protein [Conidiobolus coronatus NRRL 28638]|uniref:Di-copper centre-containing protein n=1 Tax=Conidiobolus coronatus (strain ATCC 28846 / CBS 209.66 / NRRL 28638) TaxID=796925 RepID=A0A137P4K7_CONC2|nr:Di-copper centre-containing protein [Conidiobolus coronatus NRRL 28638]|eukprot:KXN69935.1 Di-copper centre-containing protein [Conidiobolus coronatus NRRL 28638]